MWFDISALAVCMCVLFVLYVARLLAPVNIEERLINDQAQVEALDAREEV